MISFLSIILLLLLSFSLPSQAKPLDRTSNALSTIPSGNAPKARSLTHTKTINITRTRVLEFNLFSNGAAYQISSASITRSYQKVVRDFNSGIAASVEKAKFAKKVLDAAVGYQYGNLRMEMRYLGLEPYLKSAAEFVKEKWTWDTIPAIADFVQDFIWNGFGGSLRMILELASGVYVYIVFGLPVREWLDRGGLHVP